MKFAPQTNWTLYESLTRDHDAAWIRSLTSEQKFQIYCDLHNTIHRARRNLQDWSDLEDWQWEQKLAMRRRMVDALQKLDRIRRERGTPGDAV